MIFEYGLPDDIPLLMERWFGLFNRITPAVKPGDTTQALAAYVQLHVSFVRIHPFFDGNGRLARLVANIPVLRAGLPPIVIPGERRRAYIDALSAYHFRAGQIKAGDQLLPEPEKLLPFTELCEKSWQETISLVETAREKQRLRRE